VDHVPQLFAHAYTRQCSFVTLAILLLLSFAARAQAATVTATWNPNPEPNIAGYQLSYGTASGSYTTTIDVGKVTSAAVTVTAGQTYYFAVRAYNTSGGMSPYSAEVSATASGTTSAPSIVSLSPSSGAAGTMVSIAGANFGSTWGTSTVTFNGMPASPTSWSSSSVSVPVPTGATSGNVVVTVGGVASNGQTFTVGTPSAIAFVQRNYATPQSPTASVSVPFAAAQTAGNLNVVVIGWSDSTNTLQSVTDSRGNVYVSAVGPTMISGLTQSIYYAKNIGAAGAGANSVTVTFSGAASYPDVRIAEYQGIDTVNPFDAALGASGTSTTSDSGALTTKTTNELLVGANTVTNTTMAAGPGYTSRVITSPDGDILEDRVVSAAGTYNATATLSGGSWVMQAVAFRGAVAGTGAVPSITSLSPVSGTVGTAVTITGSNFGSTQGTSTVRFNGTTATPTNWSSASIVVPVPAGATTGNVVVTVNGVASNGQTFTVTTSATISLVQHVDVDAGSTASASQAFPASNVGGNFIALAIRAGSPNQTFTISDTRGNVYREAARFNNNSDNTVALYYAENVMAGTNTVTITMPSATTLRFSLFEYRGIAASNSLDGVHTAAGTGVSPNSGTVTTTANGDLLIGVVSTEEVANFTPGSGFAVEGAVPALPGAKLVVEDAVLATAGTLAATGTISASDQWGATMAAFKAAAGGASVMTFAMTAAASGPTPDDGSRASDYDGDLKSDLAVFTPSTGRWSVLQSSSNYINSFSLVLGTSTDVPVPGDYDGDGKADVAVYTPSTGRWSVLKSTSSYASGMSTTWGVTGDIAVPGDYDGDRKTDFAVYRPSTGEWLLTLSATQTTKTVVLGASGDKPVAGDYDGDGRTDVALFRPSTGVWTVLTSSSNYTSQLTGTIGQATDLLVPGDYDGDGRMDMAVYRPSTGSWLILGSASGYTTSRTVTLGSSADIPVPSDYDADGTTDVAVYRPSTGQWTIMKSSDGSPLTSVWGTSGSDVPLPRHP
jgi:hypothetical protein